MVALILVFVLKDSQASYTVRKRQMRETEWKNRKTNTQRHRETERHRNTERSRERESS